MFFLTTYLFAVVQIDKEGEIEGTELFFYFCLSMFWPVTIWLPILNRYSSEINTFLKKIS